MLSFLRDHVPWLAPILVFGLVIFVHELGHFIAAKATGVYAPRFSIGFGPALWARRWGETGLFAGGDSVSSEAGLFAPVCRAEGQAPCDFGIVAARHGPIRP